MENSTTGSIQLYTSEVSRVEVAFAAVEQQQQALDQQTEEQIDGFWTDPEALIMVEHHAGISTIARALIREAITHGWSLKPLDAIHLATAQWLLSVGTQVGGISYLRQKPGKIRLIGRVHNLRTLYAPAKIDVDYPPPSSRPATPSTAAPSGPARSQARSSRRAIVTLTDAPRSARSSASRAAAPRAAAAPASAISRCSGSLLSYSGMGSFQRCLCKCRAPRTALWTSTCITA